MSSSPKFQKRITITVTFIFLQSSIPFTRSLRQIQKWESGLVLGKRRGNNGYSLCAQDNQLVITVQERNHYKTNTNAIIIWIPAYQGIEGNEVADAAANAAIGSLATNKRNHTPVPYEVQIIHCKGVIKNDSNKTWITTKSTQLRKSIRDVQQQTLSISDKKEEIYITRLGTGHTKLTNAHKIGSSALLSCSDCSNNQLTVTHILQECRTTDRAKDRETEITQRIIFKSLLTFLSGHSSVANY